MGAILHTAVIVTGIDTRVRKERVRALRLAKEMGTGIVIGMDAYPSGSSSALAALVGPIQQAPCNCVASFMIATSGSKYGWATDVRARAFQEKFVNTCKACEAVMVSYGKEYNCKPTIQAFNWTDEWKDRTNDQATAQEE